MSHHCFTRCVYKAVSLILLAVCFPLTVGSCGQPSVSGQWMPSPCGIAGIDAISLGGNRALRSPPGSSAAESSTGIAAFPLLMTAAKCRLLQQHQNIVAEVVVLLTHADWLIGWTSAACMGICTGICTLICSSGGPAWSASVWTDWQAWKAPAKAGLLQKRSIECKMTH